MNEIQLAIAPPLSGVADYKQAQRLSRLEQACHLAMADGSVDKLYRQLDSGLDSDSYLRLAVSVSKFGSGKMKKGSQYPGVFITMGCNEASRFEGLNGRRTMALFKASITELCYKFWSTRIDQLVLPTWDSLTHQGSTPSSVSLRHCCLATANVLRASLTDSLRARRVTPSECKKVLQMCQLSRLTLHPLLSKGEAIAVARSLSEAFAVALTFFKKNDFAEDVHMLEMMQFEVEKFINQQ